MLTDLMFVAFLGANIALVAATHPPKGARRTRTEMVKVVAGGTFQGIVSMLAVALLLAWTGDEVTDELITNALIAGTVIAFLGTIFVQHQKSRQPNS